MSNEYAIVLVCEQTKINVTPIFGVSRINDKFCHCSRGLKIGLALFFLCSHTNRWYVALLYNQIPVWLRNMGSKFPVFHFLHANPCLRRIHPKLGSVLRRHGFGWQIRNTGSLDPIFHSQTGLGTSSGRGYRLFVPDSIKIIFCLKFQILIIFENKKNTTFSWWKYIHFTVSIWPNIPLRC